MDAFGKANLNELLDNSPAPGVSIYLPTHRAGRDTQQNRIRLKNLLGKAESELRARDVDGAAADALLAPASQLVDDTQFWAQQSDGLALFMATGFTRRYRLPLRFPERAVVAPRFYIKPLLPMLTEEGHFYVLALSLKQVRLLLGTRDSVEQVELQGAPASLAAVARPEAGERSLQHHSSSVGGGSGAVFHGGGSAEDDHDEDLKRYFREVDRSVVARLREDPAQQVLAALESHNPLNRENSDYKLLLGQALAGNPDDLSAQDLHARAWSLVRPHFARHMLAAQDRFNRQLGTGKASGQLEVVLPAAYQGRIEFLFVPTGEQRWGRFDPASQEVTQPNGLTDSSQDLLDLACEYTLKHGGMVYALQPEKMPQQAVVAAGFRY